MANVKQLLIQLISEQFGSIILDGTDEPRGLSAFKITKKRERDGDGFVYEFSINLDFTNNGREFIKNVFEAQGTDGIIFINIFQYSNRYRFDINRYQGQLQLDNYNVKQNVINTNVEPIGFQRKFLNQRKRSVNIESNISRLGKTITPPNPLTLPLAPKTIQKKAVLRGDDEFIQSSLYGGLGNGFNNITRIGSSLSESDFDNTELNPDAWVSVDTIDVEKYYFETKNYVQKVNEAGNYVIDFSNFKFDIRLDTGNSNIDQLDVTVYYAKINPSISPYPVPTKLYNESFGRLDFDFVGVPPVGTIRYEKYNQTLNVSEINIPDAKVGDEIYIWFYYGIDFELAGDSDRNTGFRINEGNGFTISADTVFPETTTKAFLIYEFLEQICKFLTDQDDCFRSEFLGRTDSTTVYPEDGDGSLIAIANGRSMRQLENQNIFGSWLDAFSSINALYCLGWAFEKLDNGLTVIRVEPKEYFYNKDITAYEFTEISQLEKFVEIDLLYESVKYGYPAVENINAVNGVDEFNSQREAASPLINVTSELNIMSKYRAAGIEIESQRRLIDSTKDSKLDDENFFIAVVRDGLGGFRVEQGIDFDEVNGVFDPDTAYNLRITPARNLRRWGKILASNVIRSANKTFAFSFGDYNYLVSSRYKPTDQLILENGDFDLSEEEPLYYPEVYKFNSKLSNNDRDLINLNEYGAIKAKDWNGDLIEAYIIDDSEIIAQNKGEFKGLRLFRKEV